MRYSEGMVLDGLYGAIIGALLTAAVAWWISRSQGKEARKAAARLQRNDVARAAHLMIAEYQDKVLAIAARAIAINYAMGHPDEADAPEDISKAVGDLVSLHDGKDILVRLEQCCPEQKNRMLELEDKKLAEIPDAYKDVSVLFGVCTDLSEGLTSIRKDLVNLISEV